MCIGLYLHEKQFLQHSIESFRDERAKKNVLTSVCIMYEMYKVTELSSYHCGVRNTEFILRSVKTIKQSTILPATKLSSPNM